MEPLRQSGAQAKVSNTIRRRRPGVLDQYEQEVRARTSKGHANDVTQLCFLHELSLCVCMFAQAVRVFCFGGCFFVTCSRI